MTDKGHFVANCEAEESLHKHVKPYRAIITTRDLLDPVAFPETALGREHSKVKISVTIYGDGGSVMNASSTFKKLEVEESYPDFVQSVKDLWDQIKKHHV